ncbi:hypothetical protein CGCF413_v007105 [Colletotrichum fructicola]|nr:hypothetical protein CGCF413_v007105 [Colletotrichum fructicola]
MPTDPGAERCETATSLNLARQDRLVDGDLRIQMYVRTCTCTSSTAQCISQHPHMHLGDRPLRVDTFLTYLKHTEHLPKQHKTDQHEWTSTNLWDEGYTSLDN